MPRERLTQAERRRRSREGLLAAATELFAERGVNGASIEQIAERAGYSRGAFYGNFRDKNDLVVELLTQRTLREFEEVSAIAAEPDPFPALRRWHQQRAEHLPEWLALRFELLLYALRNPSFRSRLAERERVALDAHEGGIRSTFARSGTDAPADPAYLALILHALEDGLLIQRMLTPDTVPEEIVVDAAEFLLQSWTRGGGDRGSDV